MMAQQKLKKNYSKIQKFKIKEKPHVCHNCMFIFPISRLIRHDLFRHVFAGWMAIDPKRTNKMSSHISVRATIPCEDLYMNIITILRSSFFKLCPLYLFPKNGAIFLAGNTLRKRPKGNVEERLQRGRMTWRDETWSHGFRSWHCRLCCLWWAIHFPCLDHHLTIFQIS